MADQATESVFVRRLGAAARAAWWTLVVGIGVVSFQFMVYEVILHCEVAWEWISWLMGLDPDVARLIVLGFMLILRIILVALLLACIFLSLWVRRLRRIGAA